MASGRLPVVGRPPAAEPVPELGPREPCAEPTIAVVGATPTVSVEPFVVGLEAAGLRATVETRVERLYECRPRLAVLVTGGLRPAAWDPRVRGLEGTFDLVLSEPRPAVARAIAARW